MYKYKIYFSILPFINTLFFGALYPTALVVQKRHIHVYITQTSAYLDKPQAVQMQQYTVTKTRVKASCLEKHWFCLRRLCILTRP